VSGGTAPNMSKSVISWHIKSPESINTPSRVPTNPDFPFDFDERCEKITLQRGFRKIHEAIVLFCIRKNVSVREAG
jgi:hypothetical protein